MNTQITRVKISDHVSVANTVAEQVQIAEAPFVDYLWSITSQFETHLSEDGCDVMMSGHWGDQIFFDWGYLVDDLRKFKFRRVFTHLNEYNTWYQEDVRNFIRKQIARELAKIILPIWFVKYYKAFNLYNMKRKSKWLEVRAIDVDQNEFYSQVPSLKSANRDPATEQAKSLYKQVRSRYHVHCLDWNYKVAGHYGLEFSFPILDVDLVQFMITLPGHLQNHLGVPRAILREAMRDLLPQSIADRTWKADFSDFVHDAIRNEVPDIIQTLGTAPACVTHKILNLDSLSKIISTAKRVVNENENTVSWRLFDILGLELWSKYFLNYYKKETQNEIRKENHEEVEINL